MAADPKSLAVAYGVKRRNKAAQPRHQAADLLDDLSEERPTSIAEAILRKKREAKIKFDDEGLVDLEANDEEGPSSLDDLNKKTAEEDPEEKAPYLKENYKRGSIAEEIRRKRAKRS